MWLLIYRTIFRVLKRTRIMILEICVAEDLYQNINTCRILHIYEYPVPHEEDDSRIKYVANIVTN